MIELPDFNSREDVLEYLTEVVQAINGEGYFITGTIEVDFRRECVLCGGQKIMIEVTNGFEEICVKCVEQIKAAAALETQQLSNSHVTEALNILKSSNVEALRVIDDSKICITCGGLAYRTGTCYTCSNCGSNEGCG